MNKLFFAVLLSAFVVSTLSYDSFTAATRAGSLVGQSRGNYVCNQVVNYALNGNKNGPLAKDYLNYGARVQTPRAGDIVVGNDGKHVGMFTNGNNFVHSSVSKYQVINANQNQLKYVFPNGYQIRRNQGLHKKFRYLALLINTITFIWIIATTPTEIAPTHFSLLKFLTIWGFLICYLYSILVVVWQDVPDHSQKWRFTYILGEIGFSLQLMICPFFFTIIFPIMLAELQMGFWRTAQNIVIHAVVPILIWLETLFNGITFPKKHRMVLNWFIVIYLLNNLVWTYFDQKPVYPPIDWISPRSYILKSLATLAVLGGFILGGKIHAWKKDRYLHHTNIKQKRLS